MAFQFVGNFTVEFTGQFSSNGFIFGGIPAINLSGETAVKSSQPQQCFF
jgi:hypothetical protein